MEGKPCVSIYCAAYNHEKYIAQALEGFVSQKTTFPFEVIVNEDASTDNTAQIIREYEEQYPHIIKPIYQTENQYRLKKSISLYHMFPKAQGKYVAVCEGDDFWTDPLKLQKQYDYMEAHPDCPLVAHKTMRVFENGKYMSGFTSYDFSSPDACSLSVAEVIEHVNDFHTSSLFYRREIYERNMAFLKSVSLFDYVTKIICATDMPGNVYVIPEVMSAYRMSATGSWSQRVRDDTEQYKNHIARSIDILRQIDAYREHRFAEAFDKEILKRQFNMELLANNRKVWRDEKYRAYIASMSKKQKVTTWLQLYFPRLFRGIQKCYSHLKKFVEG